MCVDADHAQFEEVSDTLRCLTPFDARAEAFGDGDASHARAIR
jgi:hypothetical protein